MSGLAALQALLFRLTISLRAKVGVPVDARRVVLVFLSLIRYIVLEVTAKQQCVFCVRTAFSFRQNEGDQDPSNGPDP